MLHLAYGSLVIAVECADKAPLLWLAEFMGFRTPSPSAPPHHTVRLALGPPPPFDEGPSEEVECFTLDGSFARLPARRLPDGTLALRDGKEDIALLVRGRDVTILAPLDGPASRLALLRVVRELATAHALREGHLHLHAAAVEVRGGVVAIIGPRVSGKTTLLLHALLGGHARYVTNDRLFVDLRSDPPLARGMPTIVSLREETLARFPAFARRLEATAYARHRTLAEAASASGWSPNLTPAQLRAIVQVDAAGEGTLRAAIFPTLTRDVDRFDLRPLPAAEAAARLRQGLFLAALPEHAAEAFAGPEAPMRDGTALDRLCRDLAPRLPCFAVRLGPRAYDGPAVWDAIRERVP